MAQARNKKFLFDRSFDDPNKLYLPGERRKAEVEAEAAMFDSWQAFVDSKTDVAGKIVVILQPMSRSSTGGGYGGMSGPIRRNGPGEAQKRGAVGFVMRSLSTDEHRFPHAGASAWSDGKGIPAMAIASPDAAQLSRIKAMQAKGQAGPIRLKMASGATFPGQGFSGTASP